MMVIPPFRRHRTASAGLFVALTVIAGLLLGSADLSAQGTRVVRGVTRDSSTGLPLAGALVEVRSPSFRATDRTDEEGNFRISGVPPGEHQLSVLRIGFAELRRGMVIGTRDERLILSLLPVSQKLDAIRVRGDISAIYGIVGTLPDLLPLAGTKVQVMGADKTITTDSTGGFFIPVKDPGIYLVRMTRNGYAERMFPIEVPRNRAVDGSRLLDPGEAPHPGLEVVYKDLDQRMRLRASTNAAIVPGAEIRRAGSTLIDGLRSSESFFKRGLRIADSTCVFVNGVPRPGVSLEAFRPEEIETVEVYGMSLDASRMSVRTGDRSETLSNAWPRRASCGKIMDRSFTPSPGGATGGMQTGKAFYVVVWLRK